MFRIAIVEDDHVYKERLKGYINQYSKENSEVFEIYFFSDGEEITKDYKPIYDIIFMDIEMKFMDGMSAAEFIRERDHEVILIFVTNMAQYAIEGYKVDALSYLLKPLPYFPFSQEMKRSIDRLKKKTSESIMVHNSDGVIKVDIQDIYYIESYKHQIILHVLGGKYSFTGTMKDFEKRMENYPFSRCHNGYMVNLKYVTSVQDNDAILGDIRIPISRSRKKRFLMALTDYVGGIIE